ENEKKRRKDPSVEGIDRVVGSNTRQATDASKTDRLAKCPSWNREARAVML
ncbi:hypothetical protein MGG_17728, partial [Pyricularia oryzae 70-15]